MNEQLALAIDRYAAARGADLKDPAAFAVVEQAIDTVDQAVVAYAATLPVTRHRLPAHRPHRRYELRIGGVRSKHGYSEGVKLFLQVSYYPDGHPWARRPGEVFLDLNANYEGSDLRHFVNGFAMATSLLLQAGVTPETIAHTFEKSSGGPSGDVDGHETITTARSIIDLVAKVLLDPWSP